MIPILYDTGENFVADLHIYGALAIFLRICNEQNTESESREMQIRLF